MNDVTRDPPPHAHNQRALVVAALARELARDARGQLWHWDQVASSVVTRESGAPAKKSFTAEYLMRAERIRALALGVVELDQGVDARALESMARDVTEMLDAVARVHAKYLEHQSEPAPTKASRSASSSDSWTY